MKNRNQKKPKQPRHTGLSSYQQDLQKTGSGQSEQGELSTQREQQEINREQQELHSDRGGSNKDIDRQQVSNPHHGKGKHGGPHKR